jgi:drug/metabolite transporter (DMT)-like permease
MMDGFLWGIATASCWGIAVYFLRFWRDTRDRFFLMFGAAFFVLSVNWVMLALWTPTAEERPLFYLVRLGAFVLIIWAIWDKNRR